MYLPPVPVLHMSSEHYGPSLYASPFVLHGVLWGIASAWTSSDEQVTERSLSLCDYSCLAYQYYSHLSFVSVCVLCQILNNLFWQHYCVHHLFAIMRIYSLNPVTSSHQDSQIGFQ